MECLIRKHDDHQFEVKVAYPLQRQAAADRYALDMFIFLPYQLGVNSDTCPLDAFFEDLTSYTRFKTPELSFEEAHRRAERVEPAHARAAPARIRRPVRTVGPDAPAV